MEWVFRLLHIAKATSVRLMSLITISYAFVRKYVLQFAFHPLIIEHKRTYVYVFVRKRGEENAQGNNTLDM